MVRRTFLKETVLGSASAALALSSALNAGEAAPSERVRAGFVGVGGRARRLLQLFAEQPDVEIVGLAEIDQRRVPDAMRLLAQRTDRVPAVYGDFRRLVDDPSIDVLVVGTPDHWHAIPTIMACQAGKDVYVEKPDGHNLVEGQRMVAAHAQVRPGCPDGDPIARATQGCNRRWSTYAAASWARCWLPSRGRVPARVRSVAPPTPIRRRASTTTPGWAPRRNGPLIRADSIPIGAGSSTTVPAIWATTACTGSTIARMALDMARRSPRQAAPGAADQSFRPGRQVVLRRHAGVARHVAGNLRVSGVRGRPAAGSDRMKCGYGHLPTITAKAKARICLGTRAASSSARAAGGAYVGKNRLVAEGKCSTDATPHVRNFLACVKSRQRPNADLERVGHPASVLCHLANVAWRTGKAAGI